MRKRLLFFTILMLIYILNVSVWAQETSGGIISGTLLMLDDKTPHIAVPVEAIRNGNVADLVLSDENGEYQFVNLESGQYQLRCQVLEGYVYYRATDDVLRLTAYESATGNDAGQILYVRSNRHLRNIDFRFAPFKKGTWKTYNYLDGLAGNGILDIHQDTDGNLWFATYSGGVSRYDGKKFTNFTTRDGLPHNGVWAICGDTDGNIWFGTTGGISRYDGNEFTNFSTDDGLAHNYVSAIHCDPDGILWFGTGWIDVSGGGVSRYDGKEFESFTRNNGLADNTVLSIYRAPDGVMWFGTRGYLSRYDGNEFVNFGEEDGLANIAFLAICSDSRGYLWFGTWEGGVYRYDGEAFTNFTTKNGLAENTILDIYGDSNGVLWFATGLMDGIGGVSRYDGETFVNFTVQDGLPMNSIQSIYQTSDGTMWFGTMTGGVSRYDDKGLLNFTTKDGLVNNGVQNIHRVPGDILWLGTQKGVSRYDGKEFVNFTKRDGLASNSIFGICGDSQGNLWFGTVGGGVSRYDGNGFESFTEDDGLAGNLVIAVHCAADGAVWFGTVGGGISRYDGNRFENFTKADGLTGNSVLDIDQDAYGNLWFGTRDDGAFRYDGNKFENFTEDDGLADNWIIPVYCAADGAVWFGTASGGVSRYYGKEFRNLTVEDGLANNEVNDIYASPDGDMWFATEGAGVSRYDGTIWTSLDTRDGLAGNGVYSIQQDAEGYLWFGTIDGGVTRYRPSINPPKVRIVSVRAQKQVYTKLDSIPPIAVGDDVTIECGAIDFRTAPEKRQYRYRIKELDSDWRKPVKSEHFGWTPDKPGTYTFQVQAIDRDLNYSDPASLSIAISAIPFYKTSAFTVIVSIMGGASLLIAVILATQWGRASRAQKEATRAKEEAERIQAAKMGSLRHLVAGVAHQMNNPIGAISSNNDISSRAIGRIKQLTGGKPSQEMDRDKQLAAALDILESMNQVNQTASGDMAKTVASLRSFVRLDEAEWQLADIHEGMDNVLALMEMEFAGRISITRDYSDIPRIYCSPSGLNQVLMSLLKNASEAIEGEGEIHLRTSVQGEFVEIEVSDTGKGIPPGNVDRIFDPGFTTKGVGVGVGLGLSICYQVIVDEHKGRIDVSSKSGRGTTFTIIIPLYQDEAE